MAETTTETATQPTPKPDWIASKITGALNSNADLMKAGLKTEDFDISSDPNVYWSKNTVKEYFNNDEKAFRDFYGKEKANYDQSKISDKETDFQMAAVMLKRASRPYTTYSQKTQIPDLYGRTRVGEFYGPKKYTIQESAKTQGVDLGDKKIKVEDYDGTLRLAKDNNGSLKLNDNHRPYWEPLKEGEELRSFDEVYSTSADWAGMYGLDRSYLRELGYSAFKFIPNFLTTAADSMLEVARVPFDVAGEATNEFNKPREFIKEIQTSLRGYKLPSSPHAQEGGFFDPINLFDLGLDVAAQLVSMGGVIKTASKLGASSINASRSGLLYMTGIAGGHVAQVSREAGLNPYETAVMWGVNMAAIYKIAGLSELVVKGVRPLELNQKIGEIVRPYISEAATKGITQSGMKSIYSRIASDMEKAIITLASKPGATSGAFLEGLEEVSEQVVDSGTRLLYNTISPLYDGQGKFHWELGEEFASLGYSAIGGGMGGAMAKPLMRKMGFHDREIINDFEAIVAYNDDAFGMNMINKWEKAGRLGQTEVQNRENAAALRSVLETMIKIREDAGLTDVIAKNEALAGAFADLIRSSSIGRDKITLMNDRGKIQEQIQKESERKAPEEAIAKLQLQLEEKDAEINAFNEGAMVKRYLMEGAYNVHSFKELNQKKNIRLNPPLGFNGRVFADMNADANNLFSDRFEKAMKSRSEIAEKDASATLDNYVGISQQGKERLLAELEVRQQALQNTLLQSQEEIKNAIVEEDGDKVPLGELIGEDMNILFDPNTSINAFRDYFNILAQDETIASKPWLAALNEAIDLNERKTKLEAAAVETPPDMPLVDDFFYFDFENGKSTVPFMSKLQEELQLEADKTTPSGISTYMSDGPLRAIMSLAHRRAQLNGIFQLKESGEYPDLATPKVDPAKREEYQKNLNNLSAQFARLHMVSEANKSNTEARVLAVYVERLSSYHKYFRHIVKTLPEDKYSAFNNAIKDVDFEMQTAIDEQDVEAFMRIQYELEKKLYNEYGKDSEYVDELLTHLAPSFKTDNAFEKAAYDHARRILKTSVVDINMAAYEFLKEIVNEKTPTLEQQDSAKQALRDAFSGMYNITGTDSVREVLSFSSAINGSGGAGKSAFTIPFLAGVANKLTGQNVIITTSPEQTGKRIKNLREDVIKTFGEKPDFVKFSDKPSLLEILNSEEIDGVSLIVYDEASLIPGSELFKINSKIKQINLDRQAKNTNASLLHVVYTYDSLQNGWKQKGDNRNFSISNPHFVKPGPPRLTFSFRQTNSVLNTLESIFTEMSNSGQVPSRPYVLPYNKDFDGVVVVNTPEELEKVLSSTAIVRKGKEEIVYIKGNDDIVPIGNSNIRTLTSLESQGLQWDYVIAHLDKLDTSVSRAEAYTTITRAKKGVILLAPSAINITSVEGSVLPFTPMTPAPIQKENMLKELSDLIGEDMDKGIKFTSQKIVIKRPTKEDIRRNENGPPPPTEEFPGQNEPKKTEDEQKMELDEQTEEIVHAVLKDDGNLITARTFVTGEGEMGTKKKMMYDSAYQNNTQFYLTIAKVNSPGFRSVIGNAYDPENEYAVFLEGIHSSGERALIANLSLKDVTDKRIQQLPIYDLSKDVLVRKPVSSSIIRNALYKHPFIVNDEKINGNYTRSAPEKTVDEFFSEIDSKGIISSNFFIATQDISGKTWENEGVTQVSTSVDNGSPFVILNFDTVNYSEGKFKNLTNDGKIKIHKTENQEASKFRTLQFFKRKVSFQEVVDWAEQNRDKYFTRDKKGILTWTELGEQTMHSFWFQNEENTKPDSTFIQMFEEVENSLSISDFDTGDLTHFFVKESLMRAENSRLQARDSKSHRRVVTTYRPHLLNDMILAEIGGLEAVKHYRAKKYLFDRMMALPKLSSGFYFSPAMGKRKDITAYGRITNRIDENAIKQFFYTRFSRIDPPIIQLSVKDIMPYVTGEAQETPDEVVPGQDVGTIQEETGTRIQPVKFAAFLEFFKSIPGGNDDPNDARQAIRMFKSAIMGAHVMRTVGVNQEPGFRNIDQALKELKTKYLSKENEEATQKKKESLQQYALGRMFNGLLAEYFPGIAYDYSSDTYFYRNVNFKNHTWVEQEDEDFIVVRADSMVKTYLFNTPVGNRGTSFSPRHLLNIIPLVHGRQTATERSLEINDLEEVLKNNAPSLPEAKALYETFFASTPIVKGKTRTYSYRAMNSEQGLKIADSIMLFLTSGDIYIPGHSMVINSHGADEVGSYFRGSTRNQLYPTNYFVGNVTADRFKNTFVDILQKGQPESSKNTVSIGGNVFPIQTIPTKEEVLRKLQATGLPGYEMSNLESLLEKHDPKMLGRIQDYFVGIVKKWGTRSSSNIVMADPVKQILASYSEDKGLGNSLNSLNIHGRKQHLLRTTAPIFHLHTYIDNIHKTPNSILKGNLLVDEDSPYRVSLTAAPFVNGGIKILDKGRIRTKKPSKMSPSELLDLYMVDGFIAPVLQDRENVSFPVVVYADSGSEINPVFSSAFWNDPYSVVVDRLFDSRVKYFAELENKIVSYYQNEHQIPAKNITELSNLLLTDEYIKNGFTTDFIRSLPDVIPGVHFDPKSEGAISFKRQLIDDIEYYKKPNNRESFKKQIDKAVSELIEYSKLDFGTNQNTYTVVKNLTKDTGTTPEDMIGKFYANWLTMSSEFQKAFNGLEYQYDSDIEYSKRSRSHTSPVASFILRNSNWRQEVELFREANPNVPLPYHLRYEGHRLGRRYNTVAIQDPTIPVTLPDGSVIRKALFTDGSSLVTPFTRIMQDYSSGLNYSRHTGPIMKNLTHAVEPEYGAKILIKNAEFEITPEDLREGNAYLDRIFTNSMTAISFDVPIQGATNAFQLLMHLGGIRQIAGQVDADYSLLTRKHFIDALALMVENGQQDNIVHEAVFGSSYKLRAGAMNSIEAPEYTPHAIDITMKGTQLDGTKDPKNGLDTKVLTQLVNAVAINWRDNENLKKFYDGLSSITKKYIDKLADMKVSDREKHFDDLVIDSIARKDEVSARAQAALHGSLSVNDRSTFPKYVEVIATEMANNSISFPFRGGHYILKPSFTDIYEVNIAPSIDETGAIVPAQSLKMMKSQYKKFAEENTKKAEVITRRLKYVDATREDGVTLQQLYTEAKGNPTAIAAIHESLQNDNWTKGSAEIILPAEMENEFMLTDALLDKLPMHQIDESYFNTQILKKHKGRLTDDKIDKYNRVAKMINEAFQYRLNGILARIPTSGKHSAVTTIIVGFKQESLNAVEVPIELYQIQGADQDYDKGSYLTYRSLVRYKFVPRDSNYRRKPITSYDPKFMSGKMMNIGNVPTGLIPFEETIDEIKELLDLKGDDLEAARRVATENTIVRALNDIMSNPKNIVEASTSTDAILEPWKKAMKSKVQAIRQAKGTINAFNDLLSFMELHENNQAAGTDLVGIFANGAKAYYVAYASHHYQNKPDKKTPEGLARMAGFSLDAPNTVWKSYSAAMNASVDNTKLGINGLIGINQHSAPYISQMIAEGVINIESSDNLQNAIEKHTALFEAVKRASHYNRKSSLKLKGLPKESINLFYKTQELNVLSSMVLNRELPTEPEELIGVVLSINNFINISYRDSGVASDFSLSRFTRDEDYAKVQIQKYEQLLEQPSHFVNILDAVYGMPHTYQYLRELSAVYEQTKLKNKAFNIITEIRKNGHRDEKKKLQYYYYIGKQLKEDYDFVEGYFIDGYLKSRTFSFNKNLGTPKGREKFINKFNLMLPEFKKRFSKNVFVQELAYDPEQGKVRVNDFFDIDDEIRSIYMDGIKQLPAEDREMLYIYSLITSRNAISKGSMMPFFSYYDKLGYLNYLDFEMNPTFDHIAELIDADKNLAKEEFFDEDIEKSNASVHIPYESKMGNAKKLPMGRLLGNLGGDIEIYSSPHMESTSSKEIPIMFRMNISTKTIKVPKKKAPKSTEKTFVLAKIISGAQTGVDQIGLRAAKKAGLKTGGTAPKGFLIEGNKNMLSLKEEFGVTEFQGTDSPNNPYTGRTEENVKNSDATVIFDTTAKKTEPDKDGKWTHVPQSRGSVATLNFIKKHNKPYLINPSPQRLLGFLVDKQIKTLNIAGNRGSKLTGDQMKLIENALAETFELGKKLQKAPVAGVMQAALTNQGTSIEIQIRGEKGKDFLLSVNRDGKISLFSEKQTDGTYKSGDLFAPKEVLIGLYDKYVPEKTRNAIADWTNAFEGSWAAPDTKEGKRHTAVEKNLEAELAAAAIEFEVIQPQAEDETKEIPINAIIVNEKVISLKYDNKDWLKPQSLDNGTYLLAFRKQDIKSLKEYRDFMIKSMANALRGGRTSPNASDIENALRGIGKEPSYMLKRVTDEQNNKEANKCKI